MPAVSPQIGCALFSRRPPWDHTHRRWVQEEALSWTLLLFPAVMNQLLAHNFPPQLSELERGQESKRGDPGSAIGFTTNQPCDLAEFTHPFPTHDMRMPATVSEALSNHQVQQFCDTESPNENCPSTSLTFPAASFPLAPSPARLSQFPLPFL